MAHRYIADQRLQVLRPLDGIPRLEDLQLSTTNISGEEHLSQRQSLASARRSGRGARWQPADRQLWAAGRLPTAADGDALSHAPSTDHPAEPPVASNQPLRGLREVVLSEAGLGKTTTLEWLVTWANARLVGHCAFLIRADKLPESAGQFFDTLVDQVLAGRNSITLLSPDAQHDRRQEVRAQLARLARRGELWLVFDAIDHASQTQLDVLGLILADPALAACRFVLGSRPYRVREHFARLFGHPHEARGWQFLQLDPFDEPQQRRYLGKGADGKDRYERVPREARRLLGVPRALYYLSMVLQDDGLVLRTPSDVFWLATRKMLAEGLPRQQAAVEEIQMLLAAIAFSMVADGHEANFSRVPEGEHAMTELAAAVIRRVKGHLAELGLDEPRTLAWWRASLKQLVRLNTVVQFGFLEQNAPHGIEFRDRSSQEFYAGLWMSLYATAVDAQRLWDLVYLPQDDSTGDFYWMWRYAAEMPAEARPPAKSAINPWVRSLGTVYRPGDGTAAGTKRSCEILYRSWEPMQAYVSAGDKAASAVINDWQSEFEDVLLNGNWSRFNELHGHDWGNTVAKGKRTKRQVIVWSPATATKRAQQFKDSFIHVPAGHFRMGSPLSGSEHLDDEPDGVEFRVGAFQLNRFPTLVAWFHFFDPRHDDYWLEKVGPDAPVTGVDWYDAWAFCQWAYWDGGCCRLPDEVEWEYAAKAGTDWRRRFWWGDEADTSRMTFDTTFDSGEPTSLEPAVVVGAHAHDNPCGFRDILGNVKEWTAASWSAIEFRDGMNPSFVGNSRVLRGGSWNNDASLCRSAVRFWYATGVRYNNVGFRVAREEL
ncbi:MAG: SUMF1/EgtB/PvdO family nonheme iron enzyme [Pirellulales bacterium]|nr:SUMF1/EgtB/PvdO family nonheme iron enzyme [Pirellulales bacterium]